MKRAGKRFSANSNRIGRFWAVVRYELLWNIRKKKLLGTISIALVLATLSLMLPTTLGDIETVFAVQRSDLVISMVAGIGSIYFVFFAVAVAMDSISGEFESGTIATLLTKPVSRTTVLAGKFFAAFVSLLAAYSVLYAYLAIGGTVIYGSQNNLHLLPIHLLGIMISTLIWVSLVFAVGSLSKNSVITALASIGIFAALSISVPVVTVYSDQAWFLNCVPGNGASVIMEEIPLTPIIVVGATIAGMGGPSVISTGTDSIANSLITLILYPTADVTFFRIDFSRPGLEAIVQMYAEPLSLVTLKSTLVAAIYIATFMLISLYSLKKAEVRE